MVDLMTKWVTKLNNPDFAFDPGIVLRRGRPEHQRVPNVLHMEVVVVRCLMPRFEHRQRLATAESQDPTSDALLVTRHYLRCSSVASIL